MQSGLQADVPRVHTTLTCRCRCSVNTELESAYFRYKLQYILMIGLYPNVDDVVQHWQKQY